MHKGICVVHDAGFGTEEKDLSSSLYCLVRLSGLEPGNRFGLRLFVGLILFGTFW